MSETKEENFLIEQKITNAMKVIFARLFESYLQKNNLSSTADVDNLIEISTEEMCLISSAKILALLEVKNPGFFTRRILLKCIGEENNRSQLIQSGDGTPWLL